MPQDSESAPQISDAAILLLNRATLVTHSVRSAVHELNNILQMISGYAEMLGSSEIPTTAGARVEGIIKQTVRGHSILQAVGDLARTDRVSLQTTDVATIAERALELRRYEHKRASIESTLDRAALRPAHVRIDAQQLLQAILNLIVNAEQALAGKRDGAIRLSVHADDQHVVITVANNGPGVAQDLDLVAPFVTTRGGVAAGLGLAASRLIARQSGGDLEVASGADGVRWTLRLPVAARNEA
jgi:C4-dicarboxylate-specific signal transduction histidine kinase